MKLIKAFVHHIRAPEVVEALGDAGFRNITLQDVKGMLKPLSESEQDFYAAGLVISEIRLSLVCQDHEVDVVTKIIRESARIGPHISGWFTSVQLSRRSLSAGPPPPTITEPRERREHARSRKLAAARARSGAESLQTGVRP